MVQSTPPIGKIRGFSCTANQTGVFSIQAFDHRQSFITGCVVWQETVSMPEVQRERWLAEVGAFQLETLIKIASRSACPERDFYPDLAALVTEEWNLHCAE